MRLDSPIDTMLEAWRQSMADAMPHRVVQRGLVDPALLPQADWEAGVLCLVGGGGGNFANWHGREGELGTVRATVVGFVLVGEREAQVVVEQAELGLLADLLEWVQLRKAPPLDAIYPGDFRQSQGLEHPAGWMALKLEARNV